MTEKLNYNFLLNLDVPVIYIHYEPDVPHTPDYNQDHVAQHCRHPRRKGPARREKDRLRAMKHQARIQPQDVIENTNEAVSAELILPFNGKLLPVRENDETTVTAAPAVTPTAACGPPHPYAPSKPGQTSAKFATKKKVDVDQAKKKLFVAPKMPSQEPSTDLTSEKRDYAKKEEELWSRLFK